MDSFERRASRFIRPVSKPSIIIEPSNGASRKRAAIRDDFPAPVRPTTPI